MRAAGLPFFGPAFVVLVAGSGHVTPWGELSARAPKMDVITSALVTADHPPSLAVPNSARARSTTGPASCWLHTTAMT